MRIYSIGHSDHTTEAFLGLLQQHHITVVVDVRSQPYSRWVPQFNREKLAHDLEVAGVRYIFMGDSLGGRPPSRESDDFEEEPPGYARMARSPTYQDAIERLLALSAHEQVAMLCAEGDHRQCHRGKLITPTLLERGARVLHICPDGMLSEGRLRPRQLTLL